MPYILDSPEPAEDVLMTRQPWHAPAGGDAQDGRQSPDSLSAWVEEVEFADEEEEEEENEDEEMGNAAAGSGLARNDRNSVSSYNLFQTWYFGRELPGEEQPRERIPTDLSVSRESRPGLSGGSLTARSPFRTDPSGYGAQCIYDPAHFSLWDAHERSFRTTAEERSLLCRFWTVHAYGYITYHMWVLTPNPPRPPPRTFAGRPITFIRPGESPREPVPNAGAYANPRITDPCSGVWWPRLSNPTPGDRAIILDTLQGRVDPRAVFYFPSYIVVELDLNPARPPYPPRSLAGTVAGRTALYHECTTMSFTRVMGGQDARPYNGDIPNETGRATSAPPESTYPLFTHPPSRLLASQHYEFNSSSSVAQGSWVTIPLSALFPIRDPSGTAAMLCMGCADLYRAGISRRPYRQTAPDWIACNMYRLFGPCADDDDVRTRLLGYRIPGVGARRTQLVVLVTGEFVFCAEVNDAADPAA